MNKIIKYSAILLALAAMNACYKDKGNYDYKELNELSIIGLAANYECDQDDSLNIPVKLEGTQYADTSRFVYSWEIARQIVQNGKDLHLKVNFVPGNHLGRLIVTDKSDSVKTYFRFSLRVSSATAGDVMVVLSNSNGEAELSYKRLDKEGPFAVNYFHSRFGESLGTGAKSISINYISLADHIPFSDNTTLGAMQVITKEGLRIVDKNNLGPVANLKYITGVTFANKLPPYPVQDVSGFNPEHLLYQLDMWNHNPYGGINQSGRMFLISNGALYYYMLSRGLVSTAVNQKVDGGYLAPALCYAYIVNSPQTNPNLVMRGFDVSSYILLFDNTNGRFMYSNAGGRPLTTVTKAGLELLPTYPGYKMIYASHTSTPNKCIAVLFNGTQTKLVYLHVPGNATQAGTANFSVQGTVDVPGSVINETTRFYNLRYSPYMVFATGNKVYRYNVMNAQTGVIPADVIASLPEMGYDDKATINALTVSRSEQHLLLAVSRYGTATADDGAPKGDVVKMRFNNATISATMLEKFEGVSGNPVDIKIKYQTHQRDGVNRDGVLVDKI